MSVVTCKAGRATPAKPLTIIRGDKVKRYIKAKLIYEWGWYSELVFLFHPQTIGMVGLSFNLPTCLQNMRNRWYMYNIIYPYCGSKGVWGGRE